MKINKLLLGFIFPLTFFACQSDVVGILLSTGFDKDRILIKNHEKVLVDTTITTNYSTCVALKLILGRKEINDSCSIIVNDTLVQQFYLQGDTKVLTIKKKNDSLILNMRKEKLMPKY